jgi:hypothetical protein
MRAQAAAWLPHSKGAPVLQTAIVKRARFIMTVTLDTVTLEQVQQLADRLPPRDRVRLIAHLAKRIADEPTALSQPATGKADAWQRLDALREEIRRRGRRGPTAGEQLDWDRTSRDATLRGLR